MNKHQEAVLKAIDTLQKQGKPISNKNVHAITAGSLALVGECVKEWKTQQKIKSDPKVDVPIELTMFSKQINDFIMGYSKGIAEKCTESLQKDIQELKNESTELIDNIKQVEDEKNNINVELIVAKAEIAELKTQIAVDLAKNELIHKQLLAEIEKLKSDIVELKTDKKEMQNLLIKQQNPQLVTQSKPVK